MKTSLLVIGLAIASPFAFADDVADVRAAETAFNAAQNAGRFEEMFKLMLRTRTLFGTAGGRLTQGWDDEEPKRRAEQYKAGQRNNLTIENLSVAVYGDTAVATFYRVGTQSRPGQAPLPARFRITGVWIRTPDGWKMAHRHEDPLLAQ